MEKDSNKTFVNINFNCNNRCISCIMDSRSPLNLSLEDVKKEIDQILEISNHIEFNGGEPTLNPYLFDILKYTRNKSPHIEITLISNLRMFSINEFTAIFSRMNLNNFKIATTIYGENKEINDSITRAPGSFVQQIKGLKNLIRNNIKIELRLVVNNMNYTNLKKIALFLVENFRPEEFIVINIISMKMTGDAKKNKNFICCRISDTIPYLVDSIKILQSKKFNIRLSHFPHCLLEKGLWKLSYGISAELSEVSFLESCKNCNKKQNCSGIWKSYIEIYGGGEFKPINEN